MNARLRSTGSVTAGESKQPVKHNYLLQPT